MPTVTPSTTQAFDPVQAAADNITYWAYQAGFRGPALTRIVAYGLAESGGDPHAHNHSDTTKDDSYGVWQINYYGDLLGPRTQSLGPPNSMYDPINNAKAAYALSGGGQNFSPWKSDDLNGRYAQYLPYAQAATSSVGGSMPGTPPSLPPTTVPVSTGNDCLLSLPSLGPVGGGCIFHKSQGRAVLGALILAGGVVIAGLGVVLLTGKSVSGMIPNPYSAVAGAVEQRSINRQLRYSPGPSRAGKRPGKSVSMDEVASYEPF